MLNNCVRMEQTLVNVQKEQQEALDELRKKHNTSYAAIIEELLKHSDNISPESVGYSKSGQTERGECSEMVEKLLHRRDLDSEIADSALEVTERCFEEGALLHKQPSSIAAGAEFFARKLHNENKTQKEVAGEYGVSTVTLRNAFQEIEQTVVRSR